MDKPTAIVEASRCVQCGRCFDACPIHMHMPQIISSIIEDDIGEAARWIYKTNPFAQVCGRVCTRHCEPACSTELNGKPVAIRSLERYAIDGADQEHVMAIVAEGKPGFVTGKRIAIIGSGPAGLTAAYDLRKKGHGVVVYEAQSKPGGMMRYGIPEHRLPADYLDAAIETILTLGIDLRLKVKIGKHISMNKLRNNYDAVLIATGLNEACIMQMPGSDHKRMISAIKLLRKIKMGKKIKIPKKAVVIGCGILAMDSARSLARLQQETYGRVNVTMTSLKPRENMLADENEILETEKEGVSIIAGRGPRQCVIENGELTGLETARCVSVVDAVGRFNPEYDESDLMVHEADLVIEAISQAADVGYLGDDLLASLDWQSRYLMVDEFGRTNEQWLWAAGDLVKQPDIVHSIAGGHRAAESIHDVLMGNIRKSA
ncbi:MAG: FAD-dependent oxidoreductase [Gammaproteobacteria bacterium]